MLQPFIKSNKPLEAGLHSSASAGTGALLITATLISPEIAARRRSKWLVTMQTWDQVTTDALDRKINVMRHRRG